jgi:hypothetical protein
MIGSLFESVGNKGQNQSFCYNCGHNILMHAYYSLIDGHIIMEYEPLVIKTMWMGLPMILQIPMPIVKGGVCKCKRFISKYDYERELENNG